MESSPSVRSGSAGRLARRLLMALALAACGGGDDPSSDTPEGGGGDTAAVAAAASNAPANCPQPPALDPALLGGKYSALSQWLSANNVTFTDTDTTADSIKALVKLCPTCNAVKLRIVSEARTYCMRRDSLAGKTRIAGMFVVDSGSVTPANWGRTFNPGDSILVFARDSVAPARLVYRTSPSPASTVGSAPSRAWAFRYCNDGNPGNSPQGRWRHKPQGAGQTTGGEGGTYGWMACATGCCQFYVPPPDPTLPDETPDWIPPLTGRPPCGPHS
jgi:hypothetical protein